MATGLLLAVAPIAQPTSPPKRLDTVRNLCRNLPQPLAVIQLLAGAEGGDVRRRLDGILDQAQWSSDMIDGFNGDDVDNRPACVNVVDLSARCVLRARPTTQCEIGFIGIDPAMAVAAPVALRRAVGFVLDNAVRAAGPGGHVTLEVNGTASETVILVIDDVPGLGQVPGNYSFALTITRALVFACGGAFELKPGAAGGVVARIGLPAMSSRAVAS